MPGRRKKPRSKDLTSRYLAGHDMGMEAVERFSQRSSGAEQRKIERTALLRAAEAEGASDVESLPAGQVIQVYSLFYDVVSDDGKLRLCVLRKTLTKLRETAVVVGDRVRFRETGAVDEQGRPEAVIEQVLPRQTVLTRSDSFKAIEQHPIVANADQMLIVASLREPDVRWGLVDRMLVAAQAGGLAPIVCLNKIDLAPEGAADLDLARQALAHYSSLGIHTLPASAARRDGLQRLGELLRNKVTVLAGHSGVGKSSLINALEPNLDLRTGEISGYTGKGRHTTTSARRYPLAIGGHVIDTPGVKLFGLWGVTRENLGNWFQDIETETAPTWRVESYQRILDSLP